MKIVKIKKGIEIRHNKRKGLKLRKSWSKAETCDGCFLFEHDIHCERVTYINNVCGSERNTIFKKKYP